MKLNETHRKNEYYNNQEREMYGYVSFYNYKMPLYKFNSC